MKRRQFATLMLVALTFTAIASRAKASEPAWCNPETFERYERGNNIPYLNRVHVYQIGDLTLAGLGVGASDYRYVQSLSEQYAKTEAYEKSCTWYLNKGNEDAARSFNHQYVTAPYLKGPSVAKEYAKKIDPLFLEGPVNFLSCAEKHGYVAMGCTGMKHRGPSVFAMFLSFSGCTPEHATKIANNIWGNNFVWTQTRTAIARKGWEHGNANPEARARLQAVMHGTPSALIASRNRDRALTTR